MMKCQMDDGWWCFTSNDLVSFRRNCFYALVAPNTASVSPSFWVVIQPASQNPIPVLPRSQKQRFSQWLAPYHWCYLPCDLKALCYLRNPKSLLSFAEFGHAKYHPRIAQQVCKVFSLCVWPELMVYRLNDASKPQPRMLCGRLLVIQRSRSFLEPQQRQQSFTAVLISAHLFQPSLQVSLLTVNRLLYLFISTSVGCPWKRTWKILSKGTSPHYPPVTNCYTGCQGKRRAQRKLRPFHVYKRM